MKHRFLVVNSDYALEKVFERKIKGSRVPDFGSRSEETKSGKEENKNELGYHGFIGFSEGSGGPRATKT